ncbi:MAG TPA: hypothetical protein PLB58_06900 [Bacilli bacterium]|jgi:hypothetical protein|nr:hypothetical protein [Bacilli bacterium]
MPKITGWEYFKKRWLYYLSYLFIYILPSVMIVQKLIVVKTNTDYVRISFSGFILGLVYIAFLAKRIRAKIAAIKPGAMRILIQTVANIIPFLTVGFLVVLVKKALQGFDITVWAICISIFLGGILQAIEWIINRRFLYALEIDALARKEVDAELRKKELLKELEQANE